MNNKIIATMKLFKSYLIENIEDIPDVQDEKSNNFNLYKEALKKRNLY